MAANAQLGSVLLDDLLPLLHCMRVLGQDLLKDQRVHVAAQHVQDPPVTKVRVSGYCVGHLLRHHSITRIQQPWTDLGHKHDHCPAKETTTQSINYTQESKDLNRLTCRS